MLISLELLWVDSLVSTLIKLSLSENIHIINNPAKFGILALVVLFVEQNQAKVYNFFIFCIKSAKSILSDCLLWKNGYRPLKGLFTEPCQCGTAR